MSCVTEGPRGGEIPNELHGAGAEPAQKPSRKKALLPGILSCVNIVIYHRWLSSHKAISCFTLTSATHLDVVLFKHSEYVVFIAQYIHLYLSNHVVVPDYAKQNVQRPLSRRGKFEY